MTYKEMVLEVHKELTGAQHVSGLVHNHNDRKNELFVLRKMVDKLEEMIRVNLRTKQVEY